MCSAGITFLQNSVTMQNLCRKQSRERVHRSELHRMCAWRVKQIHVEEQHAQFLTSDPCHALMRQVFQKQKLEACLQPKQMGLINIASGDSESSQSKEGHSEVSHSTILECHLHEFSKHFCSLHLLAATFCIN